MCFNINTVRGTYLIFFFLVLNRTRTLALSLQHPFRVAYRAVEDRFVFRLRVSSVNVKNRFAVLVLFAGS